MAAEELAPRDEIVAAGPAAVRWSWSAAGAAWVLALGVDFFLHAGLLARLYFAPSTFLLPPAEALRRIPLGYLAFLILTLALGWLVYRLQVRGAAAGFRLGLGGGTLVWGALLLGLASITPASPSLLAAWWIGQSLELGASGAVLGAATAGMPMRRLWTRVTGVVLILVVLTVVLQSLGSAPAVRVGAALGAGPDSPRHSPAHQLA